MLDLLLIEWVTKMKPASNSVEDHPQLSHNSHPVDGALVGAGSLWPVNHCGLTFWLISWVPPFLSSFVAFL